MRLKVVSIIALLITLGFGLWPFNFRFLNRVEWLEGESALRFNADFDSDASSTGVAFTNGVLDASAWDAVSIVFEVKGRSAKKGLGVIFEVYDEFSNDHSPLKIAQWQEHLAIRSGRVKEDRLRGYSEIGYRDCMSNTQYTRILIVSNAAGTTLYCGSNEPVVNNGFRLLDPNRQFAGRIIIGNSPDGERPFSGSIRQLKVYDRLLSIDQLDSKKIDPVVEYDFSEPVLGNGEYSFSSLVGLDLVIPQQFVLLDKSFLRFPSLEHVKGWGFQKDFLLNLFGFIPLGLCFTSLAKTKQNSRQPVPIFLIPMSLCFLVSFVIEFTQGFLVFRDSSQLDLILNTIGGGLSVLLFPLWSCMTRSYHSC